jgi:Transglycosylase
MTVTRRLVSGMLPSASAPKSERGLVICLAAPSFPSLASGFLTLDTVFVGVRAHPPRFRSPTRNAAPVLGKRVRVEGSHFGIADFDALGIEAWSMSQVTVRPVLVVLIRAAMAGEDARFCRHHGFDWGAIATAWVGIDADTAEFAVESFF